MRLRGGQAIGALGDLLALPALRQFGEMVEMRCIYGVSGLDDEVHVFKTRGKEYLMFGIRWAMSGYFNSIPGSGTSVDAVVCRT
jgi:hypothetical protein